MPTYRPSPAGGGGTRVPSMSSGTWDGGGATPCVDHWSRSSQSARCTCCESSGLRNCWQRPLDVGLPAPPCCLLDSRYNLASGWSGRSTVPVGSVLISEPAFTQYSLDEENSMASGQVSVSPHFKYRPSV